MADDRVVANTAATIADALAAARRQLGLTQVEVAELAGLPRAQIINLEAGNAPKYVARLDAVLDVCGLELVVRRRTEHLNPDATDLR